MKLRPYLTAYYVMTLTLNVLATGMSEAYRSRAYYLIVLMTSFNRVPYLGRAPPNQCILPEEPDRHGPDPKCGPYLRGVRGTLHCRGGDQRYC